MCILLKELICRGTSVESIGITGRNVVTVEAGTCRPYGVGYCPLGSDGLHEHVQIVPKLGDSQKFADRLQRLLRRLLTCEAAPGPMLTIKEALCCVQFGLSFPQPILSPLHLCVSPPPELLAPEVALIDGHFRLSSPPRARSGLSFISDKDIKCPLCWQVPFDLTLRAWCSQGSSPRPTLLRSEFSSLAPPLCPSWGRTSKAALPPRTCPGAWGSDLWRRTP